LGHLDLNVYVGRSRNQGRQRAIEGVRLARLYRGSQRYIKILARDAADLARNRCQGGEIQWRGVVCRGGTQGQELPDIEGLILPLPGPGRNCAALGRGP
jgi:hypothetical protein